MTSSTNQPASTAPGKRPPPPPKVVNDPEEVRRLIDAFTKLEASDPKAFAEAIADNIMDPDPAETEAFRSEELAFKSLAAARWLIDNTTSLMRDKNRGKTLHRRTEYFRNAVGRERRVLEQIVAGMRARDGVLPTAPSPRQRALRRLATENLKGDVPQGRFRDILEEEKALDAARAEERKRARKEAKRSARKKRS